MEHGEQLRYGGRFYGFRVNCESVPRLPAAVVRWALDDPRRRPYVFLWRDWRADDIQRIRPDEIREALFVARYTPKETVLNGYRYAESVPPGEEWVSASTLDGKSEEPGSGIARALRVIRVPLPRNGGRALLLVCPGFGCGKPRRHLYAWEIIGSRVARRPWLCRTCARLRFASEGEGRNTWGPYPRYPWDPYVFSSLEQAQDALDYWKREERAAS